MKAHISDRLYLTGLTSEQTDQIKQTLTFRIPKYDEALQFGRSPWSVPVNLGLFEDTPHGLAIPSPLDWLKGCDIQNKYKKRFEIYQQGFEVRNSPMSTVCFYGEDKEEYLMKKVI